MGADYVRLAAVDSREAALKVLRILQENGIVEAHAWPVAPAAGWWASSNLGPHMVTVADNSLSEARKLVVESGLLNRMDAEL